MNKLTKFAAFAAVLSGITYFARKFTKPVNAVSNNNETNAKTSVDNENLNRTPNAKSEVSNYRFNAYNDRDQKMFKDLGMTDAQQKRYTEDYSEIMAGWKKKNPNMSIDEKMLADQHNATLNSVLNEDQYAMYREWFEKNPA